VDVVDHVNFPISGGDIAGYLGSNGSGNSTTVKMLTGLVDGSSGRILHDGVDIRQDLDGFKRRLGYVPEEAHVRFSRASRSRQPDQENGRPKDC
jgi:ABC-2 type transport system ATP-binding protein